MPGVLGALCTVGVPGTTSALVAAEIVPTPSGFDINQIISCATREDFKVRQVLLAYCTSLILTMPGEASVVQVMSDNVHIIGISCHEATPRNMVFISGMPEPKLEMKT
uniref:Uncharacterized protein n=1 Tax=Glossina pallidipes TaxID=7398 RepID=A0A1A9ZUJ5_GLOPL